jgi:hypothetical protein
MVADHLLEETNKGHGQKLMALFLWSTGVLEHWSIGTAQLRNSNSVFDLVIVVCNPQSAIQNLKSERRW